MLEKTLRVPWTARTEIVLSSEIEKQKIAEDDTAWKKFKSFSKRINWFQVTKLALPLFAGFIPGLNAIGSIGNLVSALSNSIMNPDDKITNSATVNEAIEKITPEIKELWKSESAKPVTEQIEGLRREFQELLEQLNVKLIVLVDDLDRCLPEQLFLRSRQ